MIENNNLSVVIRCKNEENWVGHTIQSIFDHLGKTEIIVVDNNSKDKSIEIVKSFLHNPK
jgi:glycosyltransferase involved in cell wall biosynthesis